ncbi:hypothetical protein GCM10010918_25300 [Paenibacillus radicis (ex Gao et al. 2016)]|uniref:Uncharacterized protein n=1 Tax=Paenibacillus radicis (ex Gao et al. 2016) TaxID=1737354 RepID=A0A917H5Z4_9BACL|nr:hypothetical protein GCM10010918_25300 [Paenibacillus radicis (ex Gao et al. 2016)]
MGICSILVTIFYIPQLKETIGIEIMQFLGSEVGSESKAVNIWYPISLLFGVIAVALSFLRISERILSIYLLSILLIAVVQFLPFSLWMLVIILNMSYLPGVFMFLLHSTMLVLSTVFCLQLLKQGKKIQIDE